MVIGNGRKKTTTDTDRKISIDLNSAQLNSLLEAMYLWEQGIDYLMSNRVDRVFAKSPPLNDEDWKALKVKLEEAKSRADH